MTFGSSEFESLNVNVGWTQIPECSPALIRLFVVALADIPPVGFQTLSILITVLQVTLAFYIFSVCSFSTRACVLSCMLHGALYILTRSSLV
jgi:hypothetical protein